MDDRDGMKIYSGMVESLEVLKVIKYNNCMDPF